MSIHPTAIVHDLAQVDETAEIGPYAVIEQAVRIGPDVRVYPHAFITGWTQVGAGCEIHPGATIGHAPQDLSYTGVETYCRIGERTVIREGASIHRGTVPGSATVVGKRCFIMAGALVAHNCVLGDEVKLANVVQLGGHVQIGDGAFIGGGNVNPPVRPRGDAGDGQRWGGAEDGRPAILHREHRRPMRRGQRGRHASRRIYPPTTKRRPTGLPDSLPLAPTLS